MTATILPLNHVACPRCNGGNILGVWENGHCPLCKGENHILNPLIEEWRTSTNPARMIEMLGDKADERRLQMWASVCGDLCESRWPSNLGPGEVPSRLVASWTMEYFGDNYVSRKEVCNILRCLFPNPNIERERVECPECEGEGTMEYLISEDDTAEFPCETCHGAKEIEAPIIDPSWRSSTVMDLARTIRGVACQACKATGTVIIGVERSGRKNFGRCGNCNGMCSFPELFERMPILGDALLGAGCDDDEIIIHCQCGEHVGGCWVVKAIIGS